MKNLTLSIKRDSLPSEQEKSNTQLALEDRLRPSEAIEIVGSMIRGFPHKGQADQNYLASIAEILVRYPRSVAEKCAHPVDGVIRDSGSFLPTIGLVVEWCEKATRPLHEAAVSEARINAQLAARDEWNAKARPMPQRATINYEQFLKHCEETGSKPRPIGAFETGGYLGPRKE